MVEDWGTARERQRRRRRWKWVAAAIAVVVLAPILAAFLLGVLDGVISAVSHPVDRGQHLNWIGVTVAMPLVIAIQYRLWRAADEVERSQINIALAIGGITALATLPILSLAQQPLGIGNPAMIGWSLASAALVMTRIVQRLRG